MGQRGYKLSVTFPRDDKSLTDGEKMIAMAMVQTHYMDQVGLQVLQNKLQGKGGTITDEQLAGLAKSAQVWFAQFFPKIEVTLPN